MEDAITVQATINAPIEKVWQYWTEPEHITKWAFASDDWHAPHAENDIRTGGKFLTRMEAKDGSSGFDFNGVYSDVVPLQKIAYAIEGGRMVEIIFEKKGENETAITETFQMEHENPAEMQRAGWQSILDAFKRHVETN